MKYAEAAKLANDLRSLADFIDNNGAKLPRYGSHTFTMRYYLTVSDYVDTGNKDEKGNTIWDTVVDEAKTKANTRNFVRALGSCEKEYNDNQLIITKKFGDDKTLMKIVGQTDRSVTCKRVVVGTKVEPSHYIPERVVDLVEWECDEAPSLLALTSE